MKDLIDVVNFGKRFTDQTMINSIKLNFILQRFVTLVYFLRLEMAFSIFGMQTERVSFEGRTSRHRKSFGFLSEVAYLWKN